MPKLKRSTVIIVVVMEHFIHDWLLLKASRVNAHLNCKEGTALKKGAQAPQTKVTAPKTPQEEAPKA